LAVSPCPSLCPSAPFLVVFVAAVFAAVAAQCVSLAVAQCVPLALVALAVHLGASQVDPQAAQSVPCALLAVRSGAPQVDPQAAHLEPVYSSAFHLAAQLAGRSDVSRCDRLADPQAGCSAVRWAGDHWWRAAVS
jgi:hypothetical protein